MYTGILVFFAVFLKNRNIISKIKRSKVTDYAALTELFQHNLIQCFLSQGMLPLSGHDDVALFE